MDETTQEKIDLYKRIIYYKMVLGVAFTMITFFITTSFDKISEYILSHEVSTTYFILILSCGVLVLFLGIFYKKTESILLFLMVHILSGIFLGLNIILYPKENFIYYVCISIIIFVIFNILVNVLRFKDKYYIMSLAIVIFITLFFSLKLSLLLVLYSIFSINYTNMVRDSAQVPYDCNLSEKSSLPYSLNISITYISILIILLNF